MTERTLADVTISARFCGPKKSGNGGYTCGSVARHLGNPAEVTLRVPPPLDRPLALIGNDEGVHLRDGDTLVAEGTRLVTLDLEVPDPVSYEDAERAARSYPGFSIHPFPHCFVCGPQREPGDGLRIFPSPVAERGIVAAPWIPPAGDASADGTMPTEIVWGALDCSGGWAPLANPSIGHRRWVSGRQAAHVVGPVHAGRRYVVCGWVLRSEGRKVFTGSALFDEGGTLLGYSRIIWIELPPA